MVDYLLITGGGEMKTSGPCVPRAGETVQISGSDDRDGMYEVHTVVNWVKRGDERDTFDAGLPRVMLLGSKP